MKGDALGGFWFGCLVFFLFLDSIKPRYSRVHFAFPFKFLFAFVWYFFRKGAVYDIKQKKKFHLQPRILTSIEMIYFVDLRSRQSSIDC